MLDKFKESVKDFSENVKSTVAEKELDEDTLNPLLEELRLKLLQNNVSLEAAEAIEEELRETLLGENVRRGKAEEKVNEAVKQVLLDLLDDSYSFLGELQDAEKPPVVFMMGFNGSGKTTTSAKLTEMLQNQSEGVVLGAGDTFRAASIEQLQEHGEKLDTKVISHEYESDPAAVAYDAVEHAENEDKIALIDTAGRSHADQNLMNELEKMVRVNDPDISFLVVDALSGNDVLEQADAYEGMFDAIIVTKMDVDENGGAIISISQRSGKPVAYIGTGQKYGDLEEFDKEEFVEEILE
ncbi:signal recognition particle-docking protein FtsY [Candidatus Nanohalobium constans]|uniref:Fused signal recognition particle receptor n=1 Tax=Candidatus Nanohalobium constans TaxID=2565781 RepID=A0A5Q0UI45_9ARCH|nr:signal recognition particle-docking protein FtsY [Candidatus Nanohalobium constans]QGA80549.1 fused signal recognition particle receptor [Candidatus Nanohalobium constans]